MTETDDFLKTKYGLKENPFTNRSGITDYFVGREEQKERWSKIVDGRKGAKGSSLNFIVGDYGYGKSLTLYTILKQYEDDPTVLNVYMKLLREDLTPKFGIDFIQRIFFSVSPKQINKSKAKKALSEISETFPQPSRVLSEWIEGNELAVAFLSGREQLKAADLALWGIRQNIKSTDVAKEYLTAFLFMLKETDISTMLLCIDEVEYLFSQMSGTKVANVINFLREIYDLPTSPQVGKIKLNIANIVFFFGISQSGWTELTNLERKEISKGGPVTPFLSRKQQVIELGSLSGQETEKLIEYRLKWNRVKKQPEKEPLIPYTDDFVNYVYELTLGNPREIIERCDYTLEDGLEQKIAKLSRSFARTVFESRGLSTEVGSALSASTKPRKK